MITKHDLIGFDSFDPSSCHKSYISHKHLHQKPLVQPKPHSDDSAMLGEHGFHGSPSMGIPLFDAGGSPEYADRTRSAIGPA